MTINQVPGTCTVTVHTTFWLTPLDNHSVDQLMCTHPNLDWMSGTFSSRAAREGESVSEPALALFLDEALRSRGRLPSSVVAADRAACSLMMLGG